MLVPALRELISWEGQSPSTTNKQGCHPSVGGKSVKSRDKGDGALPGGSRLLPEGGSAFSRGARISLESIEGSPQAEGQQT